ncbi:hypothetical protein SteCoe_7191 [Stentor coeruleus]|uniref:Uncharacterized protein n=1 Tax=Stentor coeruleus TaxID=5963 RepID=A0A1R2CN92_9CILI|nr:hypothetical protein SteCoe_7191 [Stentor coeruleus]
MDNDVLQQPYLTQIRTATNLSFASSHCSLEDLSSEDFYELCKARLKVSKKNAAIMLKLKGNITIPELSFYDSNEFEEQAQKKLQELRKAREIENERWTAPIIEKQDLLSTFVFFLVKEKHLQIMIPDYEVVACKEIFNKPSCHEACFGLARLYGYEGKFYQALEYLNMALSYKNDIIYKVWQSIFTVKITKQTETETVQAKSLFSSLLCCNPTKRSSSVINLLQGCLESSETLWGYMELSLKGFSDLDLPEHYASRIKSLDPYMGYLSWSEVYFRRNEWQKSLDILKQLISNYNYRPEAYIKLWYHYYYNVKDYEQADGIISEALLSVGSLEYHNYYILFCVFSAKTHFKLKRTKHCLYLLQRKYLENPTYSYFLYMYGKYCTKSNDYMYNGTAIGALYECIRLCDISRYAKIYYWLTKAYIQARQYIEAFYTAKLALQYIGSSSSAKSLELRKWMLKMQSNISKIEDVERILDSDFDSEAFRICKKFCNDAKDIHKFTADIIHAKMLWKTGRHEEALKKLYAVSGISTVKMNAYFLLLKYLGEQNNFKCMKTIGCEMVIKCKNPQVPANVWVKANLLYAKILVKNDKPGKAILILKLLAKVLPPIPFANINYTKILQRAQNLQDLTSAHLKSLHSCNTYNYSTYKNSYIERCIDPREFSHGLIGEEGAPMPIATEVKIKERGGERRVSEQFSQFKVYSKKITYNDRDIETEEKKENIYEAFLVPPREFKLLTVCSDFTFLYKIAKIAYFYNVSHHDGICAIYDYIELLKFERDNEKRNKMMEKAEKIKRQFNAN